MYELPKVHKEQIPMRPIVSTIGSPTYRLAKELSRILTSLLGKNSYTVMNSSDFVHRIRDVHIDQGDQLISLDVTSLFTQVPVDDALNVLKEKLNDDRTQEERTSIPVAQVMQLTELCLRSTYFQFQNQFYEQTDGAAMGSPLSPIIANLFMEHIEEKAITTAPFKPSLWIHYVDDTVIWPHGPAPLKRFHEHLNQQCPSIQFTMETEDDGKIPFLDVLITRNGTQLSTSVYRKPTHTDGYLPFHSHHHLRMLTGVMQCMRNRAHQICEDINKQKELDHLEEVFIANGYPVRTVKKTFSSTARSREKDTEEDPAKPMFVPYVRGVSE